MAPELRQNFITVTTNQASRVLTKERLRNNSQHQMNRFLAVVTFHTLVANLHEFLDASYINDRVTEIMGVAESIKKTTHIFGSCLTFLMVCLVYSPVITIRRLQQGHQLETLIELVQYNFQTSTNTLYERKCTLFGLMNLFKFLDDQNFP